MFVVIEGIEASGKTTLLKGLQERAAMAGRDVLLTREPGGTATGEAIRTIFLDRTLIVRPLTEAFLASAARSQHVEEVLRPALASGRLVLCDRYTDSTLAYQGYGRGLELQSLQRLCAAATGGVDPDLTLLVDLPVEAARARLNERAYHLDRIEGEDDSFHRRVRDGYLELAKNPRHKILDGTLPREQLLDAAWNFISTS